MTNKEALLELDKYWAEIARVMWTGPYRDLMERRKDAIAHAIAALRAQEEKGKEPDYKAMWEELRRAPGEMMRLQPWMSSKVKKACRFIQMWIQAIEARDGKPPTLTAADFRRLGGGL